MPVIWPGEGRGDSTEMARFRVVHPFFCILVFLMSLPVYSGGFLVLKGERTDVVVDVRKDRAWVNGSWQALPEAIAGSGGLVGRSDAGWWHWSVDGLRVPGAFSRPVAVSDGILPLKALPLGSLQRFLIAGAVMLPEAGGWAVVNTAGRVVHVPWEWRPVLRGTVALAIPAITRVADRFFLLDKRGLWVRLPDRWKLVMPVPERESVGAFMIHDGDMVGLVQQQVDAGDFRSFRIRVTAVHARTLNRTVDASWPGIMKEPFGDGAGAVVFEYIKPSLLSALLDRKKMRFRRVNLETGSSRTRTISIGSKRRHVYPVWDRDGRCRVVVQCKNGEVWLVDPMAGLMGRLNRQFSYDYEFVRGEGNGAFVDSLHHRVVPVDFSDFR